MADEPNKKLLNEEDCKKIFENYIKHQNFEICNIEIKSLSDKVTGMMAEYYDLIITAKVNDNEIISESFFCKHLVMFHKIQEIMGKAQGAYEKEEYIYNFLINKSNDLKFEVNFAPKCFLTKKDDMFVLENLMKYNYEKAKLFSDIQHLKLALDVLAEFHACSIIIEELESKNLNRKYNLFQESPQIYNDSLYRKQEDYLGRHWFKNCLNSIIKLVDLLPEMKLSKTEIRSKLYNESIKVYNIIAPSKKYRNVCCHGDVSKVNLLYCYENDKPIDCKIVDYQALRYNPPAHDVINCIYLFSDYKFRTEYINILLEHYYSSLKKHCARCAIDITKIITEDEFYETCKFVMPQVILQAAFYSTMIPVISHFPEIEKDQELYKKFVYEDRSEECLHVFGKGTNFKDEIIELMQEFCDLE